MEKADIGLIGLGVMGQNLALNLAITLGIGFGNVLPGELVRVFVMGQNLALNLATRDGRL